MIDPRVQTEAQTAQIDRLADVRQAAGDILEPQRAVAALQPLVLHVEHLQQRVGGFRLRRHAAHQFRFHVVDQPPVDGHGRFRDGLAVIDQFVLGDFARQAFLQELVPVARLRARPVLVASLAHPAVRQFRRPQVFERRGQLRLVQGLVPWHLAPGFLRRVLEQVVHLIDRVADQPTDRAGRFALGQQVYQGPQLGPVARRQHGVDRAAPQPLVHQLLDDLPAEGKAEFQSEAAGDLGKQAVQRTDPQPVQRAHDGLERVQARFAAPSLVPGKACQFPSLPFVAGRLGQSSDDTVQNLAGCFARKRRGQDRLARHAPPHER